jgi:urease accessory protein
MSGPDPSGPPSQSRPLRRALTGPTAAALLNLTHGHLPPGAVVGRAPAPGDDSGLDLHVVRGIGDLRPFLYARLRTVGSAAAEVAAAAAATASRLSLADLDVLASARLSSAGARQASRRQGHQLLRVAATAWPSPIYRELARMPHHAVALGILARVGGLRPLDAALAAASGSVSAPACASVSALGFDPLAVRAVLTGLGTDIDRAACAATTCAESGRISSRPARRVQMCDRIWEPGADGAEIAAQHRRFTVIPVSSAERRGTDRRSSVSSQVRSARPGSTPPVDPGARSSPYPKRPAAEAAVG